MWKRVTVAGLSHNSPGFPVEAPGVFSDWPLEALQTELNTDNGRYSNADGGRGRLLSFILVRVGRHLSLRSYFLMQPCISDGNESPGRRFWSRSGSGSAPDSSDDERGQRRCAQILYLKLKNNLSARHFLLREISKGDLGSFKWTLAPHQISGRPFIAALFVITPN